MSKFERGEYAVMTEEQAAAVKRDRVEARTKSMRGNCKTCGIQSNVSHHGLRQCPTCALEDVGLDAQDAFYRAVAALLRDVVEEHGQRPAHPDHKVLECGHGCGKRRSFVWDESNEVHGNIPHVWLCGCQETSRHAQKPCTTNFGCSCDDCEAMRAMAKRAEGKSRYAQAMKANPCVVCGGKNERFHMSAYCGESCAASSEARAMAFIQEAQARQQDQSHISAMARQNAYARAAEQQQAIHARWYDQYGSLQQQTTRLDAAVKHAAQVYGVTEEQVRAADESARVLGGSVVFGVEGFKEEIAECVGQIQEGHAMLKEACGQSCSTCGTELLSDESRARGTCYDHRGDV